MQMQVSKSAFLLSTEMACFLCKIGITRFKLLTMVNINLQMTYIHTHECMGEKKREKVCLGNK